MNSSLEIVSVILHALSVYPSLLYTDPDYTRTLQFWDVHA